MINTLTLNPAIDRILHLDRLERNVTNRVRSSSVSIGGKGTHVSVNLRLMGTVSRAFGLAHGRNGKKITDLLSASGVCVCFAYSRSGESRDNYLLVEEETGDCTLIADRGPQPAPGQLRALFGLLEAKVADGDLLALSGDVSNFPNPGIYNDILDLLGGRRLKVFLDASGISLQRGVERKPFLIKPNRQELSSLTGCPAGSLREVVSAISRLDPYGIEVIAVSLGAEGSVVRAEDRLYKLTPPKIRARNTVGCGDCYLAGLLRGFELEEGIEQTLRYATAVSAAKAEFTASVGFDPERIAQLLGSVDIRRL